MVQVMVSDVGVTPVTSTLEMTGATAVVAKVELVDVANAFALLAEVTSKS